MKKFLSVFFVVGGIAMAIGVITHVSHWEWSAYLYTIGAGLFALAQVNSTLPQSNFILKRLRMQQFFSAALYILTAVFMFYTHGNEWVVSFAVACIIQLYVSFRIPHELEKIEK